MDTNNPLTNRRVSSRRRLALLAAPIGLALAVDGSFRELLTAGAAPAAGSDPTFDPARSAPRGFDSGDLSQVRAARPVAMRVETAGIDADIESIHIVDGVMQDPTDPFLVSWYEESAALGERGNALFAGHVDWHTVGAAVFFNLGQLGEGDEIVLTGDDGQLYRYDVRWRETVEVATLSAERLQELVGRTRRESVTLITCGGEFDAATGHYLARTVVRGERVRP